MTTVHIAQNNFTAGQLDPTVHERYEYQGYLSGLSTLDNFLILPQGGVTRRPGTRFVKAAKSLTAQRLIPFVISPTEAYVVELGAGYMRFYSNNARVEVANVPVEVVTAYLESELDTIHFATYINTMVLTHPNHPPKELIRVTGTSFTFNTIVLAPPPSQETGSLYGIDLTLGAITGLGVTLTATSIVFFPSDVDRVIASEPGYGVGRATITGYTSGTVVTVDITADFPSVNLVGGQWRILGSPVCQIKIDKSDPVGARVVVTSQLKQPEAPELVTDGNFPNLANWSDFSARSVLTGTATDGGDEFLEDTFTNFTTSGVRVGYRIIDTGSTDEDTALAVSGFSLTTSLQGATWAATTPYEIKKTGTAIVPFAGRVNLDGGLQGLAHIEQGIPTIIGVTYRITFDVSESPLSMMVGDSTDLSNTLAEFSYPPGNAIEVFFTATNTNSVIAFRNNQNQIAGLSNVSVKIFDIAAWHDIADIGRLIRVNSGIVEIISVTNNTKVVGIIRKSLDDALDALPGAWSLEDSQWSATLGFPNTLTFQGGRLNFGGSRSFPNRIWGSRISLYDDFGLGVNASDPYQFDLAANEVTTIRWMAGERALLVGTDTREFTVRGELGHTITPTNVDVSSPTAFSSASIQPARAPLALLFVPRSRKRLYENAGVDEFSQTDREVQDRSITAESLTSARIDSLSYQQEPHPIVWVVTRDGKIKALTYLREQVVAGWATQTTMGTVRDVCTIPHPDADRDQTWILVERQGGTPYLEFYDDDLGYYGQLMTDSAAIGISTTPLTSLGNLSHLEGQEVDILADGIAQLPQTVVGGQVTLDPAALVAEAGLSFESRLTTLRPTYQNIPLSGLHLSSVRVSVTFLNTLNALVNGEQVNFGEETTMMDSVQPLFSGPKEIETIGWDLDAFVTIVQDQPYPMTVLDITRYLEIENYARP